LQITSINLDLQVVKNIYILCPKKFISPDTTWRQITMQDMDARHGM